jgi:uncharacterized protein (DUF1800 family)
MAVAHRPSQRTAQTRTSARSSAQAAGLSVYAGPFGPEQAERLLWRGGFGPQPDEASELAALGLREAVLYLTRPGPVTLEGPAPVLEDGRPIDPYGTPGDDVLWWLDRMVRSSAPLVERMTLIWHDWFATSIASVGSQRLMIAQNETQRGLCLGSFDRMFAAMTIDPAMLVFLSGAENVKEAPNENYAREMQEIFTLGVDGGYTERDVREHARALTGWTCTWSPASKEPEDFHFDPARHDDGVKLIYGRRGRFDWRDSVRLVLSYPSHPGYFVSRLWSYFSPEPLPAKDARAAQRLYVSSGFAIRPVLEAMLVHPLVYEGPRMVKPPIVQIAGMLRAIGRYIDTDIWVGEANMAGQLPFSPPNVSGWDATKWLNTGTWQARFNLASAIIGEQRVLSPAEDSGTVPGDPRALVEAASAFWGSPTLSAATSGALLSYAQSAAVDAASKEWQREEFPVIALNALRSLVAATPDYHTC